MTPNPLEAIDPPPRQKQKLPDYYTEEELKAILRAARATGDHEDYAMIRLFMFTGIRSGELAQLRPDQVYAAHIEVDGKTGEGTVPIDPETHKALKPMLELGQPYVFPARSGGQFQGAAKGRKRGHGTLRKGFEPTGEYLRKRGLYDRVRNIIDASGVEVKGRKRGPHVLRHSFARAMLSRTGDLRLVQRLLRHASIVTTQIYTHLAQEDVNRKYQEYGPARWLDG